LGGGNVSMIWLLSENSYLVSNLSPKKLLNDTSFVSVRNVYILICDSESLFGAVLSAGYVKYLQNKVFANY